MDSTTAKIKVTPVELEPCSLKLEIEVPAEVAKKTYSKVLRDVAAKAALPGFRQGKVPQAMLMRNFGPRIVAEATEQCINQGYREAIAPYKEKIIGEPQLDQESANVMYKDGEDMKFAILIETYPTFELPEYKKIPITREPFKVTDDDVEKSIEELKGAFSNFEDVQRPTQKDDILIADYSATLPEGLTVPEAAENYIKREEGWLALREPEFLPGISTVLLGLKPGDEKDATLTFPADFRIAELAGKSLPYHFKIRTIKAQVKPELDTLVERLKVESVDKLRELTKRRLEFQAENLQRRKMADQIQAKLFAGLNFALPKSMLENAKSNALNNRLQEEKRKGTPAEEVKQNLETIKAEAEKEAAQDLRMYFVLQEIAKAEQIKFTQEDSNELFRNITEQAGDRPIKNVIKEKQDSGEINNFIQNRIFDRVIAKLIDLADVTDVTPAEV